MVFELLEFREKIWHLGKSVNFFCRDFESFSKLLEFSESSGGSENFLKASGDPNDNLKFQKILETNLFRNF